MAQDSNSDKHSENLSNVLSELENKQKLEQAKMDILNDRVWELRNQIAKEKLRLQNKIPPLPETSSQKQS